MLFPAPANRQGTSCCRRPGSSRTGRPTTSAAGGCGRVLGGAMRQGGGLEAAGLCALEHSVGQLTDDHANARLIAARLAGLAGVALDLTTVQTNIVVFRLDPGLPDAATIVGRA